MKYTLNGRTVIDTHVIAEEIDEAYFSEATFEDNGERLNIDELDELGNLYSEDLFARAWENKAAQAEALYDEMRGH